MLVKHRKWVWTRRVDELVGDDGLNEVLNYMNWMSLAMWVGEFCGLDEGMLSGTKQVEELQEKVLQKERRKVEKKIEFKKNKEKTANCTMNAWEIDRSCESSNGVPHGGDWHAGVLFGLLRMICHCCHVHDVSMSSVERAEPLFERHVVPDRLACELNSKSFEPWDCCLRRETVVWCETAWCSAQSMSLRPDTVIEGKTLWSLDWSPSKGYIWYILFSWLSC